MIPIDETDVALLEGEERTKDTEDSGKLTGKLKTSKETMKNRSPC